MRGFFVRLFKLVVVPIMIIVFSFLTYIPFLLVAAILVLVNIISYLFCGKWVIPKWLKSWPEPLFLLIDKITDIKETK